MANIEINNVSKIIHKRAVITDISMSMQSGKIYGLQGINGSGKTMLMRLVSGLIRPTHGQIKIDEEVLGKDITFPNSIGLLLENPSFLDGYTGFTNLKFLASIKKRIDDVKIHNTLLSVNLDPNDTKKYRKFSLGMKQRLGIAAAIMEDPGIVIMDEPTNSLDTDGVDLIKAILNKQRTRGALVIISCHDLDILRMMSDEIFLLESGKVVNHLVTPKYA